MSKIEKMEKYIEKTNLTPEAINRYCMHWAEMDALYNKMRQDTFGALCLAFDYGQAKGYRAAKAEVKRG